MNENLKTYYQGNEDLKRKGVNLEYTPEQVAEVTKCFKDINYFLSNYVYIISLDKGKVLFEPYEFQKEMLQTFKESRFSVANLGRQLGKCCSKDINIHVRNKKTGDVYEQSIGEFYQQRRIERDMSKSD